MSIEEMNQYWESLTNGRSKERLELRDQFHDDQQLLPILDMLDELFQLSLEIKQQSKEEAEPEDGGQQTGSPQIENGKKLPVTRREE
jgi:hypothetical protein